MQLQNDNSSNNETENEKQSLTLFIDTFKDFADKVLETK